MKLNPYLFFSGHCAEAFKFYEQVLNGKIVAMLTHGETPMAANVAEDWQNAIVHARLIVGEQVLMGSDAPCEMFKQPQGFSVSLFYDDSAESERVFHALAENGEVRMPIQETFWAVRFGMCVDRFGIPWMISTEKPLPQ